MRPGDLRGCVPLFGYLPVVRFLRFSSRMRPVHFSLACMFLYIIGPKGSAGVAALSGTFCTGTNTRYECVTRIERNRQWIRQSGRAVLRDRPFPGSELDDVRPFSRIPGEITEQKLPRGYYIVQEPAGRSHGAGLTDFILARVTDCGQPVVSGAIFSEHGWFLPARLFMPGGPGAWFPAGFPVSY